MNTREDHVVETSNALDRRGEASPPAVTVRTSLASTSFLYDVLTPQRLQALRNLPFEVAKVGLEPQLLRDYLPTRSALSRSLQARLLGFLRENGFKPLVDLFTLSPRLAAAFAIPFGVTSLFGVLSFGMEAVLVALLGTFFALVFANDAARRLLSDARSREDAPAELGRSEPLRALPAPAPMSMAGSVGEGRIGAHFFSGEKAAARSSVLLREGA